MKIQQYIETATEIASDGYETDEDVNEKLDNAEKKILNIVKTRQSSEFKSIKDVLIKTESDLEKLAETKGEITGLATGWYDFDKLTAGLHENEFINQFKSGKYKPELLFDDKQILERIIIHPMAMWRTRKS